jgi:hypothetical protein
MRRKSLLVGGSLCLFAFAAPLLLFGGVNTPEFSTGVATGAVLTAIGLLAWAIQNAVTEAKQQKKMKSRLHEDLLHVTVRIFFPWPYWYIPTSLYFRRDLGHQYGMKKLLVNWKTRKAFFVGDYAQGLLIENRIQWHSEKACDLHDWAQSQGLTLIEHEATEEDVYEGVGPGVYFTEPDIKFDS